jgi:quinohemoprotein ethanol dehydrogenase
MRQAAVRRARCIRWAPALLCAACTAGAQVQPAASADKAAAPPPAPVPAPAFTAAQLLALPTDSWITNGGNLYNQRYSPLDKINRGNVAQLKANWRIHLEDSGNGSQYSGQGQALVRDGVIYISTGASDVFAVAVDTGAVLWRYTANVDAAKVRPCCGWVNRGVAMNAGKIYVGRLDNRIVALDQRNGRELWSTAAEDPLQGFTLTAAPVYVDGLVIVGFAGGEAAIRGRIKAFNADTGALVWTFYTIPGPGEFGHDTWPQDNDAWKYGGAPIWQTPAVDPQLGLLYFTTGNAAPDYNGAGRAGDNLFTVSMLALEVKTGKYRWHFQQVHHDIWDYDSPNPVILFDAPYNGRMRKGIAEVSKTGWVYILDRETGKPLTPIEERSVPQEPRQRTAATQPFVIGDSVVPQQIDIAPEGFDLVNKGLIFTPFWDQPVLYKPQMGVNWPPSSYDPRTHRMFICGTDHAGISTSDGREEYSPPPGDMRFWARGGRNPSHGIARLGTFNAMDLTTNRLVWQQQWPSSCMAGTLATGGGLVFVGRTDGRFTALDSDTGRRLWSYQTDSGVAAPPTTFERSGKQYVVVLSAGTLIGGGAKGDSLWLFSLDGTMGPVPTAPDAAPPRGVGAPGGATGAAPLQLPAGPANTVQGQRLFRQFCVACHGETGMGGTGNGASLANIGRDTLAIANTAWNGKNNNVMPSFRGTLTPEQLRDVSRYIADELFPEHH